MLRKLERGPLEANAEGPRGESPGWETETGHVVVARHYLATGPCSLTLPSEK